MQRKSALEELRMKAEQALTENQNACPASFSHIENYLQELQIYHVELEMQAEELRRTQLDLLVSRNEYSELYHRAPVGYLSLTHNGMVIRANATLEAMLRIAPGALVNQPFSTYVSEADRPLFFSICQKARRSEKLRSCELILETADDSSFHAQLDFVPIEEDAATGPHYRVSLIDISERKMAEKEKLRLEREVLNTQNEESLRRLAGGIAHNFNNLLTGVIGNIELARDRKAAPEDNEELLGNAYQSALKVADLSVMMLHYLGQSAGRSETIELIESTRKLLDLYQRTVHGRLQLSYEPEADQVFIQMDPLQLAQLINNTITNAVEAVGRDQGLIRVRIGRHRITPADIPYSAHGEELAPGEYGCIEITDNGCGMDNHTLAKAMEPFFTTKDTGRGLGLSAVWGITHAHGGCFILESELHRGTRARLFFPLRQQQLPKQPPRLEALSRTTLGGRRILCVDDDQIVRMVIKRSVELLGCEVVEAEGGQEALNIFSEQPETYACVLLDFAMPDLDGNLTLQELRRHRPDIPVLLISGYHRDHTEPKFTEERPDAYLQKPFNMQELIEAIETVLKTEVQR